MNIDKDIKELKAGLTDDAVIRQTIDTIKFYKNMDNLEKVPIDILRGLYKDALEELKTYKKMTYKLAERVKKESCLDSNCYVNGLKICKGNKDCQQCILEWAKREVLKDE